MLILVWKPGAESIRALGAAILNEVERLLEAFKSLDWAHADVEMPFVEVHILGRRPAMGK